MEKAPSDLYLGCLKIPWRECLTNLLNLNERIVRFAPNLEQGNLQDHSLSASTDFRKRKRYFNGPDDDRYLTAGDRGQCRHCGVSIRDQPLPSSTSDAVTQCYLKPPRWSRAVQVNLKPKMVSVGTQTSFSPQTSTPLASPEQTDDEDDDNASVVSDLSWVPEEPMHEEDLFDEEPPYACDPHHNGIDKFIVCQEELMGLFAICPACCERSDSSIVQQEGTFVKIKQVRLCLRSRPSD
ncbi:uncharacterized protein LOC128020674 [Carassius gibelio]|uniref:uncharacterized protein LOC128020674 n=1 Tax=Carassius gibelio TaxID=101364 RepID=UPI0022796D5B|nr:uncharacterized protein LOC128020674 [Carassius gibelio]